MLGLEMNPHGGAALEKLARQGDAFKYPFAVPMKKHANCDFSYAGLKTSVRLCIERELGQAEGKGKRVLQTNTAATSSSSSGSAGSSSRSGNSSSSGSGGSSSSSAGSGGSSSSNGGNGGALEGSPVAVLTAWSAAGAETTAASSSTSSSSRNNGGRGGASTAAGSAGAGADAVAAAAGTAGGAGAGGIPAAAAAAVGGTGASALRGEAEEPPGTGVDARAAAAGGGIKMLTAAADGTGSAALRVEAEEARDTGSESKAAAAAVAAGKVDQVKADIAASFQRVAVEHLVGRVRRGITWAQEELPEGGLKHMVVAGGVAANQYVREQITQVGGYVVQEEGGEWLSRGGGGVAKFICKGKNHANGWEAGAGGGGVGGGGSRNMDFSGGNDG